MTSRPTKTVRAMMETLPATDAELAWAAAMGTNYRRAWATAPTASALVVLVFGLAPNRRAREILAELVSVLGADDAIVDAVRSGDATESASAVASWFEQRPPSLDLHESTIAARLRARVSYESLFRGAPS